jgi:hypothetical protein
VRGPAALSAAVCGAIGAVIGVVLLSGSGQPVRAQSYPHWQQLPPPPLSPGVDPVGVRIGHRVAVLGAREGALYDLQTGVWHPLRTPVPVTVRDDVVAAAGTAVLRHVRPSGTPSWWTFEPGSSGWTRLRGVPAQLGEPSAFGSEVYALSGRRVVVYSIQLGRWTRLPADPLRPVLHGRTVTASSAGTVVRGHAGPSRDAVSDRWDGLRWSRATSAGGRGDHPSVLPEGLARRGATAVRVGTRMVVVSGGGAWIHTP